MQERLKTDNENRTITLTEGKSYGEEKNKKIFIKALILVASFIMCWFPVTIFNIITFFEPGYANDDNCHNTVDYAEIFIRENIQASCMIVTYLHACINPMLYILISDQFQVACRRAVRRETNLGWQFLQTLKVLLVVRRIPRHAAQAQGNISRKSLILRMKIKNLSNLILKTYFTSWLAIFSSLKILNCMLRKQS